MSQLNAKGNKRGMYNHVHNLGKNNIKYKHGLSNTDLFKTWNRIRYRCYNKKYKQFKDYGGKGVRLSDEFNNFDVFYEYVIKLGWYKGCHISRMNDVGNYERGNIKILTPEQNRKEMLTRRYIKIRNIDLDVEFESCYEASQFIKQKLGLSSKIKTIAENIRTKGLKGSISYGYRWVVMPNDSR